MHGRRTCTGPLHSCRARAHSRPGGLPGAGGALVTVRHRAPRSRDGSEDGRAGDGRAGGGWLRCLDKEAATAPRPGEAPAARASRRAVVQRSVHARVSRQYHRTSLQALPPSATIWLCCRRVPHSQHETTAARRAAKPPADGVRTWSAMIASPPGPRRDPRSRPEDKRQPGLAAGSTTAGWNVSPRSPRRPDDPVRGRRRCAADSHPVRHQERPRGRLTGPLCAREATQRGPHLPGSIVGATRAAHQAGTSRAGCRPIRPAAVTSHG